MNTNQENLHFKMARTIPRGGLCYLQGEMEKKITVSYLISSEYYCPSSTLIVVLMLLDFALPAQEKWYYGTKVLP